MNTAIVYEPVCVNGVHARFVAGMLESLLTVYDLVVFIADPTEIAAAKQLLGHGTVNRIQWEPYDMPPPRDFTFWHRLPSEIRLLSRAAKLAKEKDAAAIVGLSFTRPGLAAAKLFARFRVPRIKYGVVAHMILATLSTSRRDRCLVRFGNPKRFRILVLGRATLNAALGAFVDSSRVFRAVTHPYSMADAPGEVVPPGKEPVVFGFPGLASEGKGFAIFLDAAERLHGRSARFVVVGRIADDCPSRERAMKLAATGVLSIAAMGAERLSIDDFRAQLLKTHYLVCPHVAASYGLIQSGAALDAVWSARPVVASRIPIFEELFGRAGDVGYLCSSPLEFTTVMEDLIDCTSTERYDAQVLNLIAARKYFSPLYVGAELAEALAG